MTKDLTILKKTFGDITGDYDFGERVIRSHEVYAKYITPNETRIFDIGMGKGAGLIAALLLDSDLAVGIDRSFDEFGHDGYSKMSWEAIYHFYDVDYKKSLLLKGDIPSTQFPEGTFDFISMIYVI